jgi:segregation and condensation protein A
MAKTETQKITALGIVAPPPIQITTPVFQGTLAALFRCVHDHKVNLLEIPLEPTCESYLEYVLSAESPDLDEAATALTVLAYLLERKAWLLLPPEHEDEPEYEESAGLPESTTIAYADIIQLLTDGHAQRTQHFFRTAGTDPDTYEVPFTVGNVTAGDLARAFERLLRKAEPHSVELLSKPRKSLQEQMRVVLLALTKEFRPIESLFTGTYSRNDAVYWFLALLELIRLHRVAVQVEAEEVLFAKK